MMMMEKREKSSSTTTGVVLGAGSGRGDEAGGGYMSSGTGGGGGSTGGFNASVRTAESLLRIVPMALCVAALVVMLKNSQSNDFGAVSYADLGGFRYLVYANGICACYSLLSALYMASVPRSSSSSYYSTSLSHAWTVFFFDQVLTYVILAAGTVSAEVIYLAYKGDAAITWSEACGVFGGFCRKATVSVGITFASLLCYVLLSLISSYRLFSNYDAPNVNANYPTKAIEATNTGAAAAAAFNAHG